MANEPQKIDGGVFIDTKTDTIVHEKPEEGIQIVPEGGVFDDNARGLLAAAGGDAAVNAVEELAPADDDAVVDGEADKTVTTKSARGK